MPAIAMLCGTAGRNCVTLCRTPKGGRLVIRRAEKFSLSRGRGLWWDRGRKITWESEVMDREFDTAPVPRLRRELDEGAA